MTVASPITILCVSSYEKGQEFLRTCKSLGCTVLLLTVKNFATPIGPAKRSTKCSSCRRNSPFRT